MSNDQAALLFAQSSEAMGARHFDIAESLLIDALLLDPDMAEAHANLAWLLDRRGSMTEAVRHYQLALELQPDNARIHLNFGALMAELKFVHAAEVAYRKALQVDPDLPGTWCNLGALLAQHRRDAEAETSLRQALALDASHTGAHFNLACLLLRQGRYAEGWQHLEFREWYQPIVTRLRCQRWQGEPLTGLSLLVVYEAGMGDVIQFCRYVPLLRAQGAAQVDVLCHPALKALLHTLDGVGDVFGFDDDTAASDWDHWVPVLSLAGHLGTELHSIPAQLPYLRAPQVLGAHWRTRIQQVSPGPALRVGLVWQGNPAFENDAERSMASLEVLQPLWEVPGVQFFSLQKGPGEPQVALYQASQPLIDLSADLHNFADTAAAVAALDLVITVDTAVAHLAGAMGQRCWVLLPSFMTDWRWLENRTDSPWYPGAVQLFRQPWAAGWAPVVAQVATALREHVAATQASSS